MTELRTNCIIEINGECHSINLIAKCGNNNYLNIKEMTTDYWSPATRDFAESTIEKVKKAKSVEEAKSAVAWFGEFCNRHSEVLF